MKDWTKIAARILPCTANCEKRLRHRFNGVSRCRGKLYCRSSSGRSRCPPAFGEGMDEGCSRQAILELAGRDRFLARVKAGLVILFCCAGLSGPIYAQHAKGQGHDPGSPTRLAGTHTQVFAREPRVFNERIEGSDGYRKKLSLEANSSESRRGSLKTGETCSLLCAQFSSVAASTQEERLLPAWVGSLETGNRRDGRRLVGSVCTQTGELPVTPMILGSSVISTVAGDTKHQGRCAGPCGPIDLASLDARRYGVGWLKGSHPLMSGDGEVSPQLIIVQTANIPRGPGVKDKTLGLIVQTGNRSSYEAALPRWPDPAIAQGNRAGAFGVVARSVAQPLWGGVAEDGNAPVNTGVCRFDADPLPTQRCGQYGKQTYPLGSDRKLSSEKSRPRGGNILRVEATVNPEVKPVVAPGPTAQSSRWAFRFDWGDAVYWGGSAADTWSSLGKKEGGVVGHGRTYSPGLNLGIKGGLWAGLKLWESWPWRTPKDRKVATIIKFVVGGVMGGLAARNVTVKKRVR